MARDIGSNGVKYDRVSIYEARAVVQAELQNLVIEPTRADTLEARRVDLDYKTKGAYLLTHVDIKHPVRITKTRSDNKCRRHGVQNRTKHC